MAKASICAALRLASGLPHLEPAAAAAADWWLAILEHLAAKVWNWQVRRVILASLMHLSVS